MEKLYKYTVTIFGFVILGILTLLNFRYTCTMDDIWAVWHEITVFKKDNLVVDIVIVFLFIAVIVAVSKAYTLNRYKQLGIKAHWALRIISLGIIGGLGLLWVFSTHLIPRMDQMWVQESLWQLMDGDFSSFDKGGYIFMCPHQTGLMWFSYPLTLIFKDEAYFAFQIINVIFLVLFYLVLIQISDGLEWEKRVGTAIPMVGIAFYPLILYSSFVYGNLIGLTLAVMAIKRMLLFVNNKKSINAILSGLYIMLSLVMKKNYLIFAIGLLCFAFVKCFSDKTKRTLLLMIALIIGSVVGIKGPVLVGQVIVGHKLDPGISSWGYIAMGLQESECAPGWYSSYCKNLCFECDYDYKLQSEKAKENALGSIEAFKADKTKAIQFFLNKTTSQWCNPTFQGVWVNQLNESKIERAGWVDKFLAVESEPIHTGICNIIVIIICLGAFLYIPLCIKDKKYTESLIFMIILVGGFIFHMVWEAKAQYTLSYFVLLIPYACKTFFSCIKFK